MFERIRRKKPKCPNNNVIHYIIRRSRSKRQHLKHHILNIVWQSFQNEYNREARKNKTRKGEMIDKLENGVKTYQEWGMSIKQYVAVYQITEITDKFYTILNSNKGQSMTLLWWIMSGMWRWSSTALTVYCISIMTTLRPSPRSNYRRPVIEPVVNWYTQTDWCVARFVCLDFTKWNDVLV